MRTICEDKFIDAQMILEKKKKLEKGKIEKREENTLSRHDGNPTDQQHENPNLELREILPRFRSWESERASEQFLIGFETRGQPNHGPIFAQLLLRASVFL